MSYTVILKDKSGIGGYKRHGVTSEEAVLLVPPEMIGLVNRGADRAEISIGERTLEISRSVKVASA